MSREFVWEPTLPSALVNAASWRLASEIVSALPEAQIRQAYTGGIYDELVIVVGDAPQVSINRNGSIHSMTGPSSGPFIDGEQLWPHAIRPGGAETIAQQVVHQLGMEGRPRNRSGHRLGYDVIAKVLATTCLDATRWDAVSGEDDHQLVRKLPDLDAPRNELWTLTASQQLVAGFWGGWLIRPGGERLDLTRSRRAGASLTKLAELTMRRQPESNASLWVDDQIWLDVFRSAPDQWGLRGDPVVWDLLATSMRRQQSPQNVREGMEALYQALVDLTGVDLRSTHLAEQVHNPAWERGGMSSGHMHCWTWRDRVMPFLRHKLETVVPDIDGDDNG